MSSIEAQPSYDAEEDWQLTKTAMSYQGSKYQEDIICAELARRTGGDDIPLSSTKTTGEHSPFSGKIKHILVSPGIRITELATAVHKVVPLAMLWIWLLFQLVCTSISTVASLESKVTSAIGTDMRLGKYIHGSSLQSRHLPSSFVSRPPCIHSQLLISILFRPSPRQHHQVRRAKYPFRPRICRNCPRFKKTRSTKRGRPASRAVRTPVSNIFGSREVIHRVCYIVIPRL